MAVRCPSCARMVSDETGYCPRCGASLVVPLRLSWLARLFWACPVCGSETPLTVQQPFFGTPSLACRVCGAAWHVAGEERLMTRIDEVGETASPVEAWLALLPPPLTWRPLPAHRLLLLPGERCLVSVERARMLAPRQSVQGQQPFGRVEIYPGVYERVAVDPLGPNPQILSTLARGPFFVTDRRVVFMGDRKHIETPLARINDVEVDEGFLLMHRPARTDTFGFANESAVRVRAALLEVRAAIADEGSGREEEGEKSSREVEARPSFSAEES